MQLIPTPSLKSQHFFYSNRIYNKLSEISNFWFRINGSISNVHTCVKVYTSCQFDAFFTKCTMLLHIRSTISLEEYTIQEKHWNERFLSYSGDMSIDFLRILCHQCARMA